MTIIYFRVERFVTLSLPHRPVRAVLIMKIYLSPQYDHNYINIVKFENLTND